MFLFLQNFRATLIPAISVPVAIIGTFFFLNLFGFTINLLTLFALVLAIGIVVDDAIVVVEAVHAKLDLGAKNAKEAAVSAMDERSVVWAGTIAFVVLVSKSAWAGNPVNGTSLTNLLVIALPVAGIYAMSASGLVVVYTTTGVFNFAQGAIGMFFAYVDWELTVDHGLPQLLVLPLVVLVIAPLFGVALDRAIMRHLQGKPLVVQLMVTVGLMFALIGLANMIWNQNNSHAMPSLFEGRGFHVGQVLLTWHRFITIVVAVGLAIGLRILLFRTRMGIAMRAVVDNRELAALEGARSSVLSSFAWALGDSAARSPPSRRRPRVRGGRRSRPTSNG